MITAQDIRERTFEKAVFGGYDMATVDTFMEEVANDLLLLQKENATLKGKMKVLVDKVEEYRRSEEELQRAILSAQKMGSQIEKSAQEKANAILNDANQEAQRIIEEATYESRAEKARLEEAKSVSAKLLEFLQKMNELDFIKQLRESTSAPAPEQPAPAPAVPEAAKPEINQTVRSIGETVAKVMDEPMVNVRPDVLPSAVVEDERPTKSFNIITDPEDVIDRSYGVN